MSGYDIIVKPVTTEKAVRLLEAENLLLLVVDKRADKPSIKKAVEDKILELDIEHDLEELKI